MPIPLNQIVDEIVNWKNNLKIGDKGFKSSKNPRRKKIIENIKYRDKLNCLFSNIEKLFAKKIMINSVMDIPKKIPNPPNLETFTSSTCLSSFLSIASKNLLFLIIKGTEEYEIKKDINATKKQI